MHTLKTPYHCGCGSGVGVGEGRSGEYGGSRHTAQPHNTQATQANHTHDPGLVGTCQGVGELLKDEGTGTVSVNWSRGRIILLVNSKTKEF